MKRCSNQTGLTLVELLASLVILSIVIVTAFSILFSGLSLSKKTENNALVQQEANYISAVLKEQHQDGANYEIKLNSSGKILLTDLSTGEVTIVGNERFKYEISEVINSCEDTAPDCRETLDTASLTNNITINPLAQDFHVRIKLINKENKDIYEIMTILSRM